MQNKTNKNKGFTLVELIVSIGLFTVVTLVAVGALLSIVGVNKKAQSFKSVMNNLNFAVESMSKSMRVGTDYHCGSGGTISLPQDCAGGSDYFAFKNSSGAQVVYRLNGTQIERSVGGGGFVGVTAPEVIITENTGLRFYVSGAAENPNNKQPKILILVQGIMSISEKATTNFSLQTTVSQREIDN